MVSDPVRNFFEPPWVAPRYARSRPDVLGALVPDHRRALGLGDALLRSALDVGCGTGLSTRPLRAVAKQCVGIDLSQAMLREAVRDGEAHYVRGRAEALPFPAASFDLLTIGCAYHWCDTPRFLSEVLRVLRPDGHLVVYDNYFFGDSPGSNALFRWLSSEHWPKLPRTPRNPLPELGSFHDPRFELVESRQLEHWVPMSREALVTYLTTQSGAVACVESGERSLEEIEASLHAGLADLVPETGGRFRFGGPCWILRPA